jgi:hypothetical protein
MLLALALAVQAADADYADAMKKVASKFKGREGVVLHIGDSITYANQYSGWARYGAGKTAEEKAACDWMHVGKDDDTDGYWLCRVDRPGNRSETAVSGIKSYEWLAGGKSGIPPLADVVKKYAPQMVVVMLGTNDATEGRAPAALKADMLKVVDTILAANAIPILSSIPPYKGKDEVVKSYNAALLEVRKERKLPFIDYHAEIVRRRPNDWLGSLISNDGVHPTGDNAGAGPGSEPTEANLARSGYLLRGVLSVRKIAEVKARVLGR